MEPNVLMPHSQETTNSSYAEPDESISEFVCLTKIRLNPEPTFSGCHILHELKKGGRWTKQTQRTQYLDNNLLELFQYERQKFQENLMMLHLPHMMNSKL
jgi:hypothetical protein